MSASHRPSPWQSRPVPRLPTLALVGLLLAGGAGAAAAAPAPLASSEAGAATLASATSPTGTSAIVAWDRAVLPAPPQRLEVVERGADGAWSAPRLVGTGPPRPGVQTEIDLAVNRRGEAVIAWRRRAADDRILLAIRSAAGTWSPLRTVAQGNRLGPVRTAIGPDGTVVVAWSRTAGGRRATRVFARVRRPGAALGPREEAARTAPSSSPLDALEAVALRGGRAVLGWYDLRGAAVARRGPGGAWRLPPRLTAPPRRGAWSVVLTPSGAAMTAWFEPAAGGPKNANAARGRVLGAVAPPGRPWSAGRRLSGASEVIGVESFFFLGIDLAVDGAGRSYAAWVRYPRLPGGGVRAAIGAGGAAVVAAGSAGGWSPGRVRSPAGADVAEVAVAGSPRAGGLVAWREAVAGQDNDLALASRSDAAGAVWEPAAPLFPTGAVPLQDLGEPVPHLGPDRSAAVQLGAFGSEPVAVRAAGAPAWSLPELLPTGAFGSQEAARVLLTAGAGYAVVATYPSDALEPAERRYAIVPILGPGA